MFKFTFFKLALALSVVCLLTMPLLATANDGGATDAPTPLTTDPSGTANHPGANDPRFCTCNTTGNPNGAPSATVATQGTIEPQNTTPGKTNPTGPGSGVNRDQ